MLSLDRRAQRFLRALAIPASLAASAVAQARCIGSSQELLNAIPTLRAGDVLVLGPGTYDVPQLALRGLQGLPDRWIVMRSASTSQRATIRGIGTGPAICIDNCAYLRLEDLEVTIQGGETCPGDGSRHGICFSRFTISEHVVIDHCWIHHVSGHGIGSEAVLLRDLNVVGCHVHDCCRRGIDLGSLASQPPQVTDRAVVRDCLIERTRDFSGGHGIHIKPPSLACTIENNVLVETGTTLGGGIVTYYAGPDNRGGRPRSDWHVIRGNVLLGSVASNQGIYAINGAVVTDNVVVGHQVGIAIYPRTSGGDVVDNLLIAHNTFYECSTAGAQFLRGGFPASVVIVNNVAAAGASGGDSYDGGAGLGAAVFASNGAQGPVRQIPTGIIPLGPPAQLFASATRSVPGIDLYPLVPSSALIAAAQLPPPSPLDVNGRPRPSTGADLGAYQSSTPNNPGWRIDRGFKTSLQPLRPLWAEIARSGRIDWIIEPRNQSARFYVLLASGSGPADAPIPLVWDSFMLATLDPGAWSTSLFSAYGGVLTSGPARPSLSLASIPVVPCGSLTLYHAAVFLAPSLQIVEVSNLARAVLRP